jgi:hypothetical protein
MWPPLPEKGFIAGRKATMEDIKNDTAAFLIEDSDPIKMETPQYAYHLEEGTGKRTPGIIIQAERTPDGKDLVAMRPVGGGGDLIALMREYVFLGKVPPKDD